MCCYYLSRTKGDIQRFSLLQVTNQSDANSFKYNPLNVMLSELQFLNVMQKIEEVNMVLLYKIINGAAPEYFDRFIVRSGDLVRYDLRHNEDFNIVESNTSAM